MVEEDSWSSGGDGAAIHSLQAENDALKAKINDLEQKGDTLLLHMESCDLLRICLYTFGLIS